MKNLKSNVLFFISDGKFGAYMQVNIQNDGPVTINLESPNSSVSSFEIIFHLLVI